MNEFTVLFELTFWNSDHFSLNLTSRNVTNHKFFFIIFLNTKQFLFILDEIFRKLCWTDEQIYLKNFESKKVFFLMQDFDLFILFILENYFKKLYIIILIFNLFLKSKLIFYYSVLFITLSCSNLTFYTLVILSPLHVMFYIKCIRYC